MPRIDDLMVERVLRTVEAIPRGRVASYGQIGQIAGIGARAVGRIMSQWGAHLPWWRVTSADGDPPLFKRQEAFDHWATEGIEIKPNGRGCRMTEFGADLDALALEAGRRTANLEGQ